ncbi:uncharacterized protein METZ01_LOCUS132685, partial [marine metagenome]
MSVFTKLNSVINEKGAAYVVLIDPDRKNEDSLETYVESANNSNVDALFVGGSLMMDGKCKDRVKRIKDVSNVPVIFFPGGVG